MNEKQVDWIAIEGFYRAGVKSVRSIAEDFGLSDTAINKRAKKGGWTRDPEGAKRQMVKARLAGLTPGLQFAAQTMEEETTQDVTDMNLGLKGARAILQAAVDSIGLQGIHITDQGTVELTLDPKDLKILSECIKLNVDTLRKIRGLDTPLSSKLTLEQLVLGSMEDRDHE